MRNYIAKCRSVSVHILLTLLLILVMSGDEELKKTETVEYVDLNRYVGLWYEIAKIPNTFQRKCLANTTASYTLRDDGLIVVVNNCTKEDGSQIVARGIAKVYDENTYAKLKVSFVRIIGLSLFWGDYWIIGLDEDYKYAVVGNPNRKYGWILGREKSLPKDTLDEIFLLLRSQGYNTDDFEMTKQS